LETKLESESFKPLFGFLVFLVQKLRSETAQLLNKLLN